MSPFLILAKEPTMNWYLAALNKYAVFTGRARRTEYWMFTLFNVLIAFGLLIIDQVSGLNKATKGFSPLYSIYSLGMFIPSLAVSVRRLHDTNHRGWWILIGVIPILGWILLLVWFVTDGDSGRNEYGQDPKAFTKA